VRGRWHPCHRKEIRESGKERTPTNTRNSSVKIRVHPWLKKHPTSAPVRGSAQQLPGVLSPLTPGPSPLPGARGAMRDSRCSSKTQIPPLAPVKRGRGVGGEGEILPGHSPQPAPHKHKHTRPHHNCPASVASVVKKTPLTRHLAVRISGWKARAT